MIRNYAQRLAAFLAHDGFGRWQMDPGGLTLPMPPGYEGRAQKAGF
jgi:hypothetical protein